jgi:hypothetical protein
VNNNSLTFTNERKTLQAMVGIYCREKHAPGNGLCEDCAALLAYAEARLAKCAYGEDKPKCSRCPIHCYKPAMREKIREVMRFAGPRMLTRHPVLAVKHLMHGAGQAAHAQGARPK